MTTMPTNISKSQKINGSLGNLYVNNWQENGRRIRMNIWYLVFYGLHRENKYLARLKKQSQYNEPTFCSSLRL